MEKDVDLTVLFIHIDSADFLSLIVSEFCRGPGGLYVYRNELTRIEFIVIAKQSS